jgi:hypothetical protein
MGKMKQIVFDKSNLQSNLFMQEQQSSFKPGKIKVGLDNNNANSQDSQATNIYIYIIEVLQSDVFNL